MNTFAEMARELDVRLQAFRLAVEAQKDAARDLEYATKERDKAEVRLHEQTEALFKANTELRIGGVRVEGAMEIKGEVE